MIISVRCSVRYNSYIENVCASPFLNLEFSFGSLYETFKLDRRELLRGVDELDCCNAATCVESIAVDSILPDVDLRSGVD